MAQAGNGEATQPFPLVIHPPWYAAQSASVTTVAAALLQTLAVQLVPPTVPSQFPSVPFFPEQATSSPVYEAQAPRVAIHPFPVVTQPESQALHAALVVRVASASVQT